MRGVAKILVILVGLLVLAVAVLLIIPHFVDLNRYKPQIEKQLAEITGRPVALRGKIDLSLFPWAGISLGDLQVDSPAGFSKKDFVSIKAFEVRVKLLPLLSKDIQVQRFIVDSPRIVLVKNTKGTGNWEGLGKATAPKPQTAPQAKAQPPSPVSLELPIHSLAVEEFAVRNGSLLWLDEKSGARNEVSGLMLELKDISLERPIGIDFSVLVDGRPLVVTGQLGPLGKKPGEKPLPFDLAVTALKEIRLKLKGALSDLSKQPSFELSLNLDTFSPRQAIKTLGLENPLQTSDPNVLSTLSLSAAMKGNAEAISLSDGVLKLDDTQGKISLRASQFDKPNLTFKIALDGIDVDRYLPPDTGEAPAAGKAPAGQGNQPASASKTDYAPLRKPVVNGTVHIGQLKIQGAKIQDVALRLKAQNGRYVLDPMTLKLYGGSLDGNGTLDVHGGTPVASVKLQAQKIQAGPLLTDVLKKDSLEGTLQGEVALTLQGDDPEQIKPTLNGQGNLLFRDGAIKGIDLASMARNVKTAFGLAKTSSGPKPRTDFSELKVPFTLVNGRFNTADANMISPLLRLKAQGSADLVRETLNFRVEPTVVATIKGQGDTKERTGLMVPILVSGTFSKPTFRPDLEAQLKERVQEALTDPEKFKETLKQDKESLKSLEKQGKDFLKGLRGK